MMGPCKMLGARNKDKRVMWLVYQILYGNTYNVQNCMEREASKFGGQDREHSIECSCEQIEQAQDQKLLDSMQEGKWTQQENIKFVIFLILNKAVLGSKIRRKNQKIFKSLSGFITSRSPQQCRSHYQKQMKKFNSIFKMKQFYRSLIGNENFDMELARSREALQAQEAENSHSNHISSKSAKEAEVQTDLVFPMASPTYDFYSWPTMAVWISPILQQRQ